MTLVYTLFALFVLLSIADGITTYRALKRPKTREANRVMRWLFDHFGIHQTLIVSKLSALGVIWYTMGPATIWVLGGWNAVYAWAIWRNHAKVGR